MSIKNFPLIFCHLTDEDGNILDPYEPGSICYTIITPPGNCVDILTNPPSAQAVTKSFVTVSISGFVAVCSDSGILSVPIPFNILSSFLIFAPPRTSLSFEVKKFKCCAMPVRTGHTHEIDQIKIAIHISTIASAEGRASLVVPELDESHSIIGTACISIDRVYDSVCFKSKTCLEHTNDLRYAETYQYNAVSDGTQRFYTNTDELKKYGARGILSPDDVSYYNLFINGELQPQINYQVSQGLLALKTENVPPKGQTVILTFVTFKNKKGDIITVDSRQYSALSDGTRRIYTNDDVLKKYSNSGIPAPSDVSYSNLYVNGVLQPLPNYTVRRGLLTLNTENLPLKGQILTLESLVIRNPCGGLYRIKTYQYNARSAGKKVFTSKDGLPQYGGTRILSAESSAYQNLFVNGVIQPSINYTVCRDRLRLNTKNAPIQKAPVSLQYVGENSEFLPGVDTVSDLAFKKWAESCGFTEADT